MASVWRISFGLDSQCPTPAGKISGNERLNMTIVTDNQLELGFNHNGPRSIGGGRREGRIARAGWWFARMRGIVENAMEAPGEPRPEQIWIPGAVRELEV